MRVIAGSARRTPLKTLEGMNTRPTTDRIKETLFNMLQYDLADCYFLDLFAGSGAIGIEALSRGAKTCVFELLFKTPMITLSIMWAVRSIISRCPKVTGSKLPGYTATAILILLDTQTCVYLSYILFPSPEQIPKIPDNRTRFPEKLL